MQRAKGSSEEAVFRLRGNQLNDEKSFLRGAAWYFTFAKCISTYNLHVKHLSNFIYVWKGKNASTVTVAKGRSMTVSYHCHIQGVLCGLSKSQGHQNESLLDDILDPACGSSMQNRLAEEPMLYNTAGMLYMHTWVIFRIKQWNVENKTW